VRCPNCRSTAVQERPERTAQGSPVGCLNCTKQFNERSSGLLNRTQYPSDVIALVVLWRLRYKLSLRDLAEMFLIRGFVFSYEAVRDGRRSSRPHWPRSYAEAGRAKSAAAGTPTSRIFGCTVVGVSLPRDRRDGALVDVQRAPQPGRGPAPAVGLWINLTLTRYRSVIRIPIRRGRKMCQQS
jgi:transposase-like protein